MTAPRHDEEIDVTAGLEIETRDAARQGDEPHERQCAHETQQQGVAIQEGAAAGFAPAPLVDEIAAAGGEEKTVAPLDDALQHLAALEHREHLRERLLRPDERLVQLLERERIVVDDA